MKIKNFKTSYTTNPCKDRYFEAGSQSTVRQELVRAYASRQRSSCYLYLIVFLC
ncbi:hypothetical protein C2G38_2237850 [Gigaspora rosea]|uniref:Uncharacterized protein n=1 Tax=Gigaspora rosea TaxID=44941 RepID=A0A397TS84_9GLOM|nr:hypothetical protein C2G38_2237850 [Gigaspora rosea]